MKIILVIGVLIATLGGCAVVPVDYGYRGERNYYRGDRYYAGDRYSRGYYPTATHFAVCTGIRITANRGRPESRRLL